MLESELVRVPPPPPVVPAPHVPVAPPIIGQYVIPPLGMPNLAQMLGGTANDQAEIVRPEQFVVGKSSGAHEIGTLHREHWNVDHFLKNGGQHYCGSIDVVVAMELFDIANGILQHMGCPFRLQVRTATRAMLWMGRYGESLLTPHIFIEGYQRGSHGQSSQRSIMPSTSLQLYDVKRKLSFRPWSRKI